MQPPQFIASEMCCSDEISHTINHAQFIGLAQNIATFLIFHFTRGIPKVASLAKFEFNYCQHVEFIRLANSMLDDSISSISQSVVEKLYSFIIMSNTRPNHLRQDY